MHNANVANNVVVYNVHFKDYEVAAIALNGTTVGILSDIYALKTKKDIPILSTYSQARFIRTFIKVLEDKTPNLKFNGKTPKDIYDTLQSDLDYTFDQFFSTRTIPDTFKDGRENYFKNKNKGYDGNVYGIVLNVKGVVINDFFKNRTNEMIGNKEIHLDKIYISNVCSHPIEIVGISATPIIENTAYGGKSQAGPLGDILEITNIQNKSGIYKGNTLSDAQLILRKSGLFNSPKTTLNITEDILSGPKIK